MSIDTVVVRSGRPPAEPGQPLNQPIVPASAFHGGGSIEYAREEAPTTTALEEALGALEHGTAIAFSSGMGAANAVMDLVPPGGVVVAPSAAYTGVAARLRELDTIDRIALRIVEADDTAAVLAACQGASLLWLESPTNPTLQVADLPACIEGAHAAGTLVLVDNTFATPILQTPLDLGADIVLHSVTKALSGHSDLILGALVAADAGLAERLRGRRVLLGAVPSAFDCYLALRGLRTLALRVARGQETARLVSDRLTGHPNVERVRYPGFGTIAAIDVAGGADAADALCREVRVWTFATSLGGVESLLERRRRWPLESQRVPVGLVRLSFGIEDAGDLWTDLDHALRAGG
ncbi:MAG: PLP-dependent transferase [Actinobacteria bacterium]|nr:PLP-dependent transferase [Actinomycetota bacterium]